MLIYYIVTFTIDVIPPMLAIYIYIYIYIKYSIHGSYIYMGIQTHNQQNYFNPNLRWWSGSFYVYNAQDPLPNGVSKNTSHGVTISIKKRGGHLVAWDLARRCAKWA